jgi:hypothetical protein
LGNVRFWGGVLALGLSLSLLLLQPVKAEYVTWLKSPLNIQKQADFLALPPSLNGNIDCTPENSACVVSTDYGYSNQNSQVKLNGSASYRNAVSFIDNRAHTLAIPSSNTVINYSTEPAVGLYLYFTNNFSSSISAINNLGTIQYQINRAPDGKLADKSGKKLPADYASINFSENGRWMVVSDPNVAMLRVNLENLDVLPFGHGFNYSIGLSPSPHTAISNDGRWAVSSSKDFDNFFIYDLDSCNSPTPSSIVGPQNCQSRDLNTLLKQQVPGYLSVSNIKFISDDTLSAYVSYKQGVTTKVAKYIISTSLGSLHQLDYLALGDSYISGEGAFHYRSGTDTANNSCHLSLISYPILIGRDLNFNSYNSAACSGAKTNDIDNRSLMYGGQIDPSVQRNQYTGIQISNILTQFQVGYIDQLDFVSKYQPKAVTISVAGNDIGFSSILKRCLEPDTCYGSYEDRVEIVRQINSTFYQLVNTYTLVRNNASPDTRIYVIGYPQLANPAGKCALNVHLNSDELQFSKLLISYLDGVIKQAADAAGVAYIDTQSALDGHKLCEAGPGSVAVNGLTAGNDFPSFLGGPIGKESYHPNDFGQTLLEQYILQFSKNLTKAMPLPSSSTAPSSESELEILQVPRTGRQINITYYNDNLTSDTIYQSNGFKAGFKGADYSVKPGTSFQAVINSSPFSLGTFSTDRSGNLNADLSLPSSLTQGFHTLHFYGQDINGQKLDIYKVVYVGSSSADFDGDGIPNDKEVCNFGQFSGQDIDQDNIDDACDGFISETPEPKARTPEATVNISQITFSFPSVLQAPARADKLSNLSPQLPGSIGSSPIDLSPNSDAPAVLADKISSAKASSGPRPSSSSRHALSITSAFAVVGSLGALYYRIIKK